MQSCAVCRRKTEAARRVPAAIRQQDFARFDLIIKEFTRQAAPHLTDGKSAAAGLGVAGPVINNRIHATNLPWVIEADSLSRNSAPSRRLR